MTDMEFESFIAPLNEALKSKKIIYFQKNNMHFLIAFCSLISARKETLSLAASKKPANKGKPTDNAEEEAADDGDPEVIEIEENEVAEIEEEKNEDENEKSVSAKPTVKKRKLSEKEGEGEKKITEEDNGEGEEEEEDSDVEEIN